MKKLILTLSIVLTLLTSCKKNEVPEPKPTYPYNVQGTCNLEGVISGKDIVEHIVSLGTKPYWTGSGWVYITTDGDTLTQPRPADIYYTYLLKVKYGQMLNDIVVDKNTYDRYAVGSNYCLD